MFILRVFFYCFWDPKPDYNIDKDAFDYCPTAHPGFNIEEFETGYYQSLALAEKRIRQIAKSKKGRVYSFVVEEKPMNYPLDLFVMLSQRRYLGNGKLWLSNDVSNIYYKGNKRSPLGNVVPRGLDPKTILFEEGDFVEIACENGVELGIVWKTPLIVDQMGNLSDLYTVVGFSTTKDGKISNRCYDCRAVDVLPASLPIPRKIAAELRKQLKITQTMPPDDDLPF